MAKKFTDAELRAQWQSVVGSSKDADFDQALREFAKFDKNGDGTISVQELSYAWAAMGRAQPIEIIRATLGDFDYNRDGGISKSEFLHMTMRNLYG